MGSGGSSVLLAIYRLVKSAVKLTVGNLWIAAGSAIVADREGPNRVGRPSRMTERPRLLVANFGLLQPKP